MITFQDKTFCASPNCKNKCGRKLPKNITNDLPICFAYFCGEPTEPNTKLLTDFIKRGKRK